MRYTQAQAIEFISKIAPIIQTEASKRGYAICSTVIAQAIIEGECNTSSLAKKYHNHFGLKCGKAWLNAGKPSICLKTSEEYVPGKITSINDYFRVYADDVAGIAGYYDFISSSRYANLKTAATYKQYAERLKSDGYATSSTYVNTLCKTVEKYGLEKYDCETLATSAKPTLKIGSRGDYVKSVQTYLSVLGYTIGSIDGIYGNKTASAVKEYQRTKRLKIDGIWGKECWNSVNG